MNEKIQIVCENGCKICKHIKKFLNSIKNLQLFFEKRDTEFKVVDGKIICNKCSCIAVLLNNGNGYYRLCSDL